MDTDRFDAFVRSLPFAPRRTALGGLLGAGIGVFLGRLGIEDAEARRKKRRRKNKKKRCRGARKRCGKRCIPKTACCGGCGTEQKCCNGTCIPVTECCACRDDQVCCAGTCAGCCSDLGCPVDAPCIDGICVCPIAGQVACGDTCTDLATDPDNCGACNNVCRTDSCIHGACDCDHLTANCPEACVCAAALEPPNTSVCHKGPFLGACDGDADCPVGSVCLVNGKCSGFCFA